MQSQHLHTNSWELNAVIFSIFGTIHDNVVFQITQWDEIISFIIEHYDFTW